MSSNFLNLNSVSAAGQQAQAYGHTSDDKLSSAKGFVSTVESSQPHMIGAAGKTNQQAGGLNGLNLGLLARQIADQAMRAAGVQKTVIHTDNDAHSGYQPAVTSADGHTGAVSRTITA